MLLLLLEAAAALALVEYVRRELPALGAGATDARRAGRHRDTCELTATTGQHRTPLSLTHYLSRFLSLSISQSLSLSIFLSRPHPFVPTLPVTPRTDNLNPLRLGLCLKFQSFRVTKLFKGNRTFTKPGIVVYRISCLTTDIFILLDALAYV